MEFFFFFFFLRQMSVCLVTEVVLICWGSTGGSRPLLRVSSRRSTGKINHSFYWRIFTFISSHFTKWFIKKKNRTYRILLLLRLSVWSDSVLMEGQRSKRLCSCSSSINQWGRRGGVKMLSDWLPAETNRVTMKEKNGEEEWQLDWFPPFWSSPH